MPTGYNENHTLRTRRPDILLKIICDRLAGAARRGARGVVFSHDTYQESIAFDRIGARWFLCGWSYLRSDFSRDHVPREAWFAPIWHVLQTPDDMERKDQ